MIQYIQEDEWAPTPGYERCAWCPYTDLCPAERICADIEEDRVAYAEATGKVARELKARMKIMKADCEAHGPILLEKGYYGTNVISSRPTFGLKPGKPGYVGDVEDDEEGQEGE